MGWAADTRARIAREQWEDYKARFQPVEDELIGLVDNPRELNAAVDASRDTVNTAFAGARGARDRGLSRRGVALSANERGVLARNAELDRTAALVEAESRTRQRDWERDNAAMGGGLSAIARGK